MLRLNQSLRLPRFLWNDCEMIVTNLTGPKLWDDREAFETLTEWIARNLGSETRLVLSSLETEERLQVTPRDQREAHLEQYRKLAMDAGLRQVFFQIDARKEAEERRQHLEKIGMFRALERLGIRQQW